jgi:hypothetical protein
MQTVSALSFFAHSTARTSEGEAVGESRVTVRKTSLVQLSVLEIGAGQSGSATKGLDKS